MGSGQTHRVRGVRRRVPGLQGGRLPQRGGGLRHQAGAPLQRPPLHGDALSREDRITGTQVGSILCCPRC